MRDGDDRPGLARGPADGFLDHVHRIGVIEDGLVDARAQYDQKRYPNPVEFLELLVAKEVIAGEIDAHGDDIGTREELDDFIPVENARLEGLARKAPLGGEIEDDDLLLLHLLRETLWGVTHPGNRAKVCQ